MCTVISNMIHKLRQAQVHQVTVLGHDQIDEDSCISSLLMCFILGHYGIEAEFKILDKKIPTQTKAVLKELGYNLDVFKVNELEHDENLFLVDHHQSIHPGVVVGCIDHHPTQKAFDYLIYDNGSASACSKKIYNYMVEDELDVPESMINMVAYALVIDTFDFKSPRGRQCDRIWLEEMVERHGLDYEKMVGYALHLTDLTMAVEKVAMCSLKAYEFESKKVMSTYILVKDVPDCMEGLLRYLQEQVKVRKLAMWVFLTINVVKSQTIEYRITLDGWEKINHQKLSSRAQEIMPEIEKCLSVKAKK